MRLVPLGEGEVEGVGGVGSLNAGLVENEQVAG